MEAAYSPVPITGRRVVTRRVELITEAQARTTNRIDAPNPNRTMAPKSGRDTALNPTITDRITTHRIKPTGAYDSHSLDTVGNLGAAASSARYLNDNVDDLMLLIGARTRVFWAL